jgi:hypothetical protein
MNKNLIYDLAKMLRKYDNKEIAEVAAVLKDRSRLEELVCILESMEKASARLSRGRPKRSSEGPSSGFKSVSNAILEKGG